MTNRTDIIKETLTEALQPTFIQVLDDSQAHAGHEGAKSGGGHFYLTIVSDEFDNKSRIQRHQLVYKALGDMMKSDIHALSIKAFTPEEQPQQQGI
ncbi:MAG: cell division protein BolA [Cycloclasticus sp. symbiont of Bathymodiolus heckerae]|nr:MAG: cell division protein BolA [Cycloclasticus sp. symbiont of Bathymodiolus heckerae]